MCHQSAIYWNTTLYVAIKISVFTWEKERLMEMPRDFGVFLHCSQILICGLISIMTQNLQRLHWVHKSFSMYHYV